MGAITWDPKVFQSFTLVEKMRLDCISDKGVAVVTTTNKCPSDLNRVVSVVKRLLEEPLPITGSKEEQLSQRGCLYFSLAGLQSEVAQYNQDVENTFWIMTVHVLLTILTLGFFSFQDTMKIEGLAAELAKEQTELGMRQSRDLLSLVVVKWSAEEIEAFCTKAGEIAGVEALLLSKLSVLEPSVLQAIVDKKFFFQNMPKLVGRIFRERCEALMTEGKEPATLFHGFVAKQCNPYIDPKDPSRQERPEAKFYAELTEEFQAVYNTCRSALILLLAAARAYQSPSDDVDLYN